MNERDENDELRALWRAQKTDDVDASKLEALRTKGARFTRRLAVRKWSETVAGGACVAIFARSALHTKTPVLLVAFLLLIVGELVVIANVWRRGTPKPPPPPGVPLVEYLAYYRAELVRERELLWTVWRWYLGPIVPGLVFLPVAVCIAIGWNALVVGATTLASVAIVCAIVVVSNRRGSRKLGREIDALDANGAQT